MLNDEKEDTHLTNLLQLHSASGGIAMNNHNSSLQEKNLGSLGRMTDDQDKFSNRSNSEGFFGNSRENVNEVQDIVVKDFRPGGGGSRKQITDRFISRYYDCVNSEEEDNKSNGSKSHLYEYYGENGSTSDPNAQILPNNYSHIKRLSDMSGEKFYTKKQ